MIRMICTTEVYLYSVDRNASLRRVLEGRFPLQREETLPAGEKLAIRTKNLSKAYADFAYRNVSGGWTQVPFAFGPDAKLQDAEECLRLHGYVETDAGWNHI